MRIVRCFFTLLLLLSGGTSFGQDNKKGGYIAGDFHQHTTYSGGENSIGYVMDASNKHGLDWWANNDHGGTRENWGKVSGKDLGKTISWKDAGVKILGDQSREGFMWRWQSLMDYNFADILEAREKYPQKIIIQAFEWNVPGQEHANVALITNQFDKPNPNCIPLAQFEYQYDKEDKDLSGGVAMGWQKSSRKDKEKAIEAISWLQLKYPKQAYVIPGHPDKSRKYSIVDLRNMNNAGPDVCFGFDGMPGHQKGSSRGGYDPESSYGFGEINGKKGSTFGGAGFFTAKIGGVWDALLSEGRHWWISASSDFHAAKGDFLPGEYMKTYTFVTVRKDPQALMDGLRSGNTFIVTGDLITNLDFKAGACTMGETVKTDQNSVRISIKVFDPDSNNFNTYSNYKNPKLDHIDLIVGKVTRLISPSNPDYSKDQVATTKVIARYDQVGGITDSNGLVSKKWNDLGDGWRSITCEYNVNGNTYLRLRGTNHMVNTPEELDGEGNPLPDVKGENNASKAFSDLWFYSNPIFISGKTK